MALHTTSFPYDIEVNIPDDVIAGTITKRKARLIEMSFSPSTKSVRLTVHVVPYASDPAAPGGYGAELSARQGYTMWMKHIIADTSSLVRKDTGELILDRAGNTLTGDILAIVDSSDAGKARAASLGVPYVYVDQFAQGGLLYDSVAGIPMEVMHEYDFYNDVAHAAPVVIADMIRSKLTSAKY
jgi:hypothetical protein